MMKIFAAWRPKMITILIVEDDKSIRKSLVKLLSQKGYNILEAENFKCYKELAESKKKIDLYLLDIYLPDGSGFDICTDIRSNSRAIIIFLTSCDDEESVIKGLNLGGDDYVTKPFRTAELVSRIEANLRRIGKSLTTTNQVFGDLLIDINQHWVKTKLGKEIPLTVTEFQLLEILIANRGLIVKRSTLLEKLWDNHGFFVEDNTLTVTVSRLKSKLGTYGKKSQSYIETIRGVGYRWNV